MADDALPSDIAARIDSICQEFEAVWQSGQQPSIEDFLSRAELAQQRVLFRELLRLDSGFRSKTGQRPSEADYLRRFPSQAAEISAILAEPFSRQEKRSHAAKDEPLKIRDQDLAQTEVWIDSAAASEEPQSPPAEFSVPTSLESRDETDPIRQSSVPSPADLPDIPGYEMLGVLGRGGMGVVLKARHRVLGRLVAIKLPLAGHLTGADERERFLREARAAAKLHHPQICPIHEVGEVEGHPYLVLHFVSGKTLREWSAERKPGTRDAASLLSKLARAIGYAHEHGVVHRDLKPGNIMMEAETGEPVLMDFGLAKELGEEASLLTQSGQVMGTPAYMAPEQAAGRLHDVGPRSDVYALGAILYELICGRRPFEGGPGEVLKQVLTDEPAPPRKLNPRLHVDLETICLKALSKDPAGRYSTATALAEDLERFAAGEPILARREPVWRKMARRVRRSSGLAVGLLLVVIAMIVGSYFAAAGRRESRLANLKLRFEEALGRGQWTAASLAEIDAVVAEIAKLDPQPADDLGGRLRTRLSSDVQSEITSTPSREMDLARYAELEDRIKLVETRAPEKAKELRGVLEASLGGWKVVFELSSGASDASLHFDAKQVNRVGKTWKANPAYDAIGHPRVLSTDDAQGPARLEAAFDATWETVTQLGLLLNAGPRQEYAFLISAPDERTATERADPNSQPPTLAEARGKQKHFVVDIFRNRVPIQANVPLYGDLVRLKSNVVLAHDAPSGPLKLRATRDGDRLTFEINGQKVLECVDLFPLSESEGDAFGLRWPATVGATGLLAERLLRPEPSNPLEQGDQLFARGDWNAARQFYEKAGLEIGKDRRQEIEFKSALCELREGEVDKALQRFDALRQESGARFPMLAACQIWLDLLRSKKFKDANAQFDLIKATYPDSKEVALALPEEDRSVVIEAYMVPGAERIAVDRSVIDRCERSEAVFELIGADAGWMHLARMDVIQSLAQVGDFNQALRKAEAYLSELPVGSGNAYVVTEYGWIAREAGGDLSGPLNQIERHLFERPGVVRPALIGLFVERARLHAAQQNWAVAESDLDDFDRARRTVEAERVRRGVLQPDVFLTRTAADANLLRGFLREHRGDIAGALSAWREGVRDLEAPHRFVGRLALADRFAFNHAFDVLGAVMLASLTDTPLSDQECDIYYQYVKQNLAKSRPGLRDIVQNDQLLQTVFPRETIKADLEGMWRSPRGRDWARRLALRNTSRRDLIRQPLLLAYAEHVTRELGGAATEEQDELNWAGSQQLADAALSNAFDGTTIVALGASWNGWTGRLGWQIASDRLASRPGIRGLLAYIIGRRLFLKQDWGNGEILFRSARDDAGKFADAKTGALLTKLAQFELDHVGARKDLAALAGNSEAIAKSPTSREAGVSRKRLVEFWRQHQDTPLGPAAFKLVSDVVWPDDSLRRGRIPPEALRAAGFGDPMRAPRELVAVLGAAGGNHWEPIRAVAVSHDGAILATGSHDGTVKLWRAKNGRLTHRLEPLSVSQTLVGQKASVAYLAFSPNDQLLASASDDGTVVVWSSSDGARLGTHSTWTHSLAFGADDKLLFSGNADAYGTIKVWDTTTGTDQPSSENEGSPVRAMALIGSDRLAVGYEDGGLRIWSVAERKLLRKWTAHSGPVTALAATRDGRRLVSGGADLKLKVWDPATDSDQASRVVDAGPYPPFLIDLTADERTIVTLCGDGVGRRFDLSSGEAAPNLPAPGGCAAFDAGRNTLVVVHGQNQVEAVDLSSGQARALIDGRAPAVSVVWSPGGTSLAAGYADGMLQLFDAATGQAAHTLGTPGAVPWSIAFSPDDGRLAAGRSDGKIVLWEAANGAVEREWVGHPGPVARIAFGPGGDILASADNSGAVKLWKLADGAVAVEWKPHSANVTGLAFTPDGQTLVTASPDSSERGIRLWDHGGNELAALEGPTGRVVDLAIDPLGRWLAAVNDTGEVKLWSVTDRKLRFAYPKSPNQPTLPNRSVTFSPNGRSFATAGGDGQVRIYDPRYYDDELPFPQTAIAIGPPAAALRQVAYSPDGRHLATANGDGTVYVLRLAPAAGAVE